MIGKVVKVGLFTVLMLAMAGCGVNDLSTSDGRNAEKENGGQTNGGEAGTAGQIGDEVSSGQTGAGGANATCKVGSEKCSCDSKGKCGGTLRCASKICVDLGKPGSGGTVGAGGSTGTGGKTTTTTGIGGTTGNGGSTEVGETLGASGETGNGGTIGIGGETTQGGAVGISGSTGNGGTLGTGGATVTETCETGSERCLCYGNGTCNAPFACYSERCVDATGLIGAGGTVGAGGTDGTGGQDSAAGQASNGGTAGTGTATKNTVAFDLPEGWSRDAENDPIRAIWWHQTADGVKPYVMLDAYGWVGTKESGKKSAQDDYAWRTEECQNQVPPCALMPRYEEKNIAGTDVFISSSAGTYWGEWSYYTNSWFEKGGILYSIEISDLVENQEDAIATVISTIHLTNQ